MALPLAVPTFVVFFFFFFSWWLFCFLFLLAPHVPQMVQVFSPFRCREEEEFLCDGMGNRRVGDDRMTSPVCLLLLLLLLLLFSPLCGFLLVMVL